MKGHNNMREIILHCFQWRISDIIRILEKVKECGYTSIQVTPIQPCKKGDEWWTYYQPLSFKIGNRSGTKQELTELCYKANKIGIKIIVDVVLRHLAGDESGKLIPSQTVDPELRDNPKFWTNAKNTVDYGNRNAIINGAFGLPMLNYNDLDLQNIYIKFLRELKNCGVGGFRIDMGKHFALESEGSYFWTRVFGEFGDMFNYAECIESSEDLLNRYTPFINVLTDRDATNQSRMVIYVMSHDTEESWGVTKNMDDKVITLKWELLLKNHKESNVLFYVRAYSDLWKMENIKNINLAG